METQLEELRRENEVLRRRLAQATATRPAFSQLDRPSPAAHAEMQWEAGSHGLSSDQIGRYSRQLLLPSFGVQGKPELQQAPLKHSA